MGFPRQEDWSELPFSSPGDHPDPGMEPVSPALAGRFFTTEPPGKPKSTVVQCRILKKNFKGKKKLYDPVILLLGVCVCVCVYLQENFKVECFCTPTVTLQEAQVPSLVQGDPTYCGVTKFVRHNY